MVFRNGRTARDRTPGAFERRRQTACLSCKYQAGDNGVLFRNSRLLQMRVCRCRLDDGSHVEEVRTVP